MEKHQAGWFVVLSLSLPAILSGCWSMPFASSKFSESTSSRNLFRYDESAMDDLGTAYHYVKSNQDGSYSADEWNYVESPSHTESFKIYPFTRIQGKTDLVVADYDLDGFFTERITAFLVSRKGERKVNATTTSTDGIEYEFRVRKDKYTVIAGHVPSYNYNFDWCDLFFMYRHLLDKESPFEVGVLVPDSRIRFIYAGKAEITYIGRREHKGRNCRFYKVRGEAFRDKEGVLYIDAESNVLVEVSMPVKNNGNYGSFKYSLIDSAKMSKVEWDAFILAKTSACLN